MSHLKLANNYINGIPVEVVAIDKPERSASEIFKGTETFEGLFTVDDNQGKYKYTARRKGNVYLKSLSISYPDITITNDKVYDYFKDVKRGSIVNCECKDE